MFQKYTIAQDNERYKLLDIDKRDSFGGAVNFDHCSVDTLKELVKKGYLDMQESFNDALSTKEFVEFMEKYREFEAHGYLVINEREDRRITIEGLRGYP